MDHLNVNDLEPPIGKIYRSRSVLMKRKRKISADSEFRSRSNTAPTRSNSVIDSLVQQTFQLDSCPIVIAIRPPTPSESINNDDVLHGFDRSTNSVSFGLRSTAGSPMAPLQGQSTEAYNESIINLNQLTKNSNYLNNNNNNNQLQQQNLITANTGNTKLETKSHKQSSSSPSSTVGPLNSSLLNNNQQQPSPKQNQDKRSSSPHPLKSQSQSSVTDSSGKSNQSLTTAKNDIPEKEKKRKGLSSSRQKKFNRHFQQVSNNEKVINYFSCALVSDILLQGHLYITENYFAFYSNVFGFVTKLLIPTSSVIKISKEKTAKIIPNAVGVATIDERHVFGSFMSREAAFRLMCSVCPPLEPIEIIPKVPDAEEYLEDDSSCSISGNESPPQPILDSSGNSITTVSTPPITTNANNNNNLNTSSSDTSQLRNRVLPAVAKISFNNINGVADEVDGPQNINIVLTADSLGATNSVASPCSTSTPIKSIKSEKLPINDKFRNFQLSSFIKFKYPQDFHIVYLGIALTILLTIMSGFLMYRILDIEAKANNYKNLDINKWSSNDDSNIYSEALKWQKELQTKSTEEAQLLLNKNLEQIAKVRKSLEALSMLIHKNPYDSSSSTIDDADIT